jgi:hypothetical protein
MTMFFFFFFFFFLKRFLNYLNNFLICKIFKIENIMELVLQIFPYANAELLQQLLDLSV